MKGKGNKMGKLNIIKTEHGFCQWLVDTEMVETEGEYGETEYDEADYARIDFVKVAPEYRGRGFGRELIEKTVAEIERAYPDMEIKIVAAVVEKGMDLDRLFNFYDSIDGIDVVVAA